MRCFRQKLAAVLLGAVLGIGLMVLAGYLASGEPEMLPLLY